MRELIAKQYKLQFEREAVGAAEYWIALDCGAKDSERLVQLLLLKQGQADSLTDAVVRRRVDDLCHARYPGLVPLVDYGFDGSKGSYYFVYDLASGPTLIKHVSQVSLSLREIARFLGQFVGFLQYLQSARLARPWITPDEIFVSRGTNGSHVLSYNFVGLHDLTEVLRPGGGDANHESRPKENLCCPAMLARFLLSNGQLATSIDEMLARVPEGCRGEFKPLLEGTQDADVDILSETSRLVAALERELAKEEVLRAGNQQCRQQAL